MIGQRFLCLSVRVAINVALITMTGLARGELSCVSDNLGCAIFSGEYPVAGHLRGDNQLLPSWTTRCINCHSQTVTGTAFAPPLTTSNLLDAKSRRGGPPSRYDSQSFCRAVRDGIDPANVLLRKAMPNYRISESECAAVWRYVMAP